MCRWFKLDTHGLMFFCQKGHTHIPSMSLSSSLFAFPRPILLGMRSRQDSGDDGKSGDVKGDAQNSFDTNVFAICFRGRMCVCVCIYLIRWLNLKAVQGKTPNKPRKETSPNKKTQAQRPNLGQFPELWKDFVGWLTRFLSGLVKTRSNFWFAAKMVVPKSD